MKGGASVREAGASDKKKEARKKLANGSNGKYTDRVVICGLVGTFGLFMSQWFGSPLWRGILIPSAFVLWFLFEPHKRKNDISAVLQDSGISIKRGKEEIVPKEIFRKETENGYIVGLTLPTGMSSQDFIKRSQRVSEALNADVDFKYKGGKIIMDVNKKQLPTMIKYEPIKYDLPNIVPIGESLTRFETLTFGNEVSSVLVAGTSGSGKSSLLKLLIGYWMQFSREDVELYLCDMKWGVEFGRFEDCDLVKGYAEDATQVSLMLENLVKEARERYQMFKEEKVYDLIKWNKTHQPLPIKVLIVDEFASLAKSDIVINTINHLGAIGRAAGIYGVYSTQYPLAEVVPSGLKFNCQARISFKVKTAVNSVVVLDATGAEEIKIPGRAILGMSDNVEVQVPFITEKQIETLIEPHYQPSWKAKMEEGSKGGGISIDEWKRQRDR